MRSHLGLAAAITCSAALVAQNPEFHNRLSSNERAAGWKILFGFGHYLFDAQSELWIARSWPSTILQLRADLTIGRRARRARSMTRRLTIGLQTPCGDE